MSDFFSDIMKNGALDSLTADQLDELIIRAQEIRSEHQNNTDEQSVAACRHCGSIRIKKHGTTSKGSIRMICKDCGKTFALSEHPDTRLTRNQMAALFMGIIENIPIGQLADRMGVSRSTAHRHKIQIGDILYQRMAENLGAVDDKGNPTLAFEGVTQCDEWYCPVSFKGKRNPEFFIWKLKRFPRHNMTVEEQKPHDSNRKTWFASCKDDGLVIDRKSKGRADINGKWADIKKQWVNAFIDRDVIKGFSIKQSVTAKDEWSYEAYAKTDFDGITEESFKKVIKDYALFLLSQAEI